MTAMHDFIDLREAIQSVIDAVLALNEAHKVKTSELDETRLRQMLDASALCLAAPDGAAFLLAFDEAASYDSPNFLWFGARRSRFLYIDRIVVAPAARGRGLARALYAAVVEAARRTGRDRVVCEVNLEPPNPGSDAFHAALGFAEAGRGSPAPGKVVRYLECPVSAWPEWRATAPAAAP